MFSSFQPVWVETSIHCCSSMFMVDRSPRITNHYLFTSPLCKVLYLRLITRPFVKDFVGMKRPIALISAVDVVDLKVPHTFLASGMRTRFLSGSGVWPGGRWWGALSVVDICREPGFHYADYSRFKIFHSSSHFIKLGKEISCIVIQDWQRIGAGSTRLKACAFHERSRYF